MAELTADVESVLLGYGVIKRSKAPSFDRVHKELIARDGRVTSLTSSRDGGTSVGVALQGNSFHSVDDDPGVALSNAFAMALEAEPRQARLIDDN